MFSDVGPEQRHLFLRVGDMFGFVTNLKKLAKIFETSPRRLLGYTLEHKESDDIWRNFLEIEMPGICRKSAENPFGVR